MNIRKRRKLKKNTILLFVTILLILLIALVGRKVRTYFIEQNKGDYAVANGACNSMDDTLLAQIESGQVQLTYECFGAKGNGSTDDFNAIKNAHNFANKEYTEKGIFLTVYGTAGATYKITSGAKTGILVATDVNWQGANFIIDDNPNVVLANDIYKEPIFRVTTPMHVDTNLSVIELKKYKDINKCLVTKENTSENCEVNSNIINTNAWSSLSSLSKNSTNINNFVNNLKTDINSIVSDSTKANKALKYLNASNIWAISITSSHINYVRRGNNPNNGNLQTEVILVNTNNGNIMGDIEWNYDEMVQIRVWPIPEKQVLLQNAEFTTWTNNKAIDSSGNNSPYTQRGIYVAFTGNVKIKNVKHYLDESKYSSNPGNQSQPKGNAYYGFIKIYNAAYIDLDSVRLTPHTYAKNSSGTSLGTYDLTFDYANNLFFNKIEYACNKLKSDGTIDYTTCYGETMIASDKWGTVGSNGSKNVFFDSAKINRIDAHRGVHNLSVTNSTLGDKGFTLTGSGYFYGYNLRMDRSANIIELRQDYGSTWNGTMILDKITYIISDDVSYPTIIRSNNDNTHYFGYQTYFPALYIRNVEINDTTYHPSKNVTTVRLNENVDATGKYKYQFKGNIRTENVRFTGTGNHLYAFTNNFAAKDNNLKLENYSGDSKTNFGHYNNDSSFVYAPLAENANRLKNSSINTKFTFTDSDSTTTTIQNKIDQVVSDLNSIENESKMPTFSSKTYALKSISINNGAISINETISSSRKQYTADVPSGTNSVSLSITGSDNSTYVDYPSTVTLSSTNTTVNFAIIGPYGVREEYQLIIRRPASQSVAKVPTASEYCLNPTYNGNSQSIIKAAETGYTFDYTTGTNAKDYNITATLNSDYKWSDNTTGTKTVTCSIKKATPTITLSATSGEVTVGSNISFTESSKIAGSFKNNISNSHATVNPTTTSELAANTNQTVTITGSTAGTSTISIAFYPTDTSNYNQVSKSYNLTVKNPESIATQIPTASEYCLNPTYNGNSQSIIKAAGTGYTFDSTTGTNAKDYKITATLKSGYKWSDNTTGTKTVTCSIKKATPIITLSASTGQVMVGSKINFIESANVEGSFTNTATNNKITISPASIASVPAETGKYVEVTGANPGTSSITISFEPTDKSNYNNAAPKTYTVTVTEVPIEKQKVAKPTAEAYCRSLVYNGQTQTLTNASAEGYAFFNNTGKDAKSYTVTAKLASNYEWTDGTSTDHTFNCSISKGTPSINFDVQSVTVEENEQFIVKVKSNAKGTFSSKTANQNTAIISTGASSNTINANTYFNIIVKGVQEGTTNLETTFTASESSNWNSKSATISITVKKKKETQVAVLADQMRVVSDYLYTGTNNNPTTIENNLSFDDNVDHKFQDNKLIIINKDTNDVTELELLNFETSYRVEGKTIFIDQPVSAEEFKSKFNTNAVNLELFRISNANSNAGATTVSNTNISPKAELLSGKDLPVVRMVLEPDNYESVDTVDDGYVLGITHQSNLLDTYEIKLLSNETTPQNDENPGTGSFVNFLLLCVGFVLALFFIKISNKKAIHKI